MSITLEIIAYALFLSLITLESFKIMEWQEKNHNTIKEMIGREKIIRRCAQHHANLKNLDLTLNAFKSFQETFPRLQELQTELKNLGEQPCPLQSSKIRGVVYQQEYGKHGFFPNWAARLQCL
jgi:hypothetical protein